MKALGHPIKFSATPGETLRPAPLLGERTREILVQLGYSGQESMRFEADSAVQSQP